nr:COBRA-like protein 7 [Ipomoea trifida]
MAATLLPIISVFLIALSLPTTSSQPASNVCNGVLVSYVYDSGFVIPPTLSPSDQKDQPYRFQSTLTVLNNGLEELKSWRVFVGFQNKEMLVSAPRAVLGDGRSFPADVSNGTTLAGYPVENLKTAVETAGDFNQMQARVELVGTQFGVAPPAFPMPSSISLVNDGFSCSPTPSLGKNDTHVCCTKDPNAKTNTTRDEEEFLPRQEGDLTIMYDVTSSYESNYWAQITISNNNLIKRLDNWHLSWEWMREEFINAMRGAYPLVVDTSDCIFGKQGEFYQGLDFSKALNCERRPTIIDLPLAKTNDTIVGLVPFCCRNGTILPPAMDPAMSKSAFVMQVYKMPPYLNRSELTPPQNWKINGSSSGEGYVCGPPVRVSPTLFPDPSGLPSETAAVASWQVVCNITRSGNDQSPKCCVSFSSFFNESVIPCNTCACGCKPNPGKVCSATAPALLLPADALLVPFDNRTEKAIEFAGLKRRDLPNPLPCGDNCGVSINWHLLTDYNDGWTARITLFNWGKDDIVDWSAALQLEKAMPGFEKVYSFQGQPMTNSSNTLFLQGGSGLNYLLAERNGDNPRRDPPVPGTQQSVISFKKKNTPGINVARTDGFPTKVFFNGEECSLPVTLPSRAYRMPVVSTAFTIVLAVLVLIV